MSRVRTYTFIVKCPLPSTPKGEPRSMTSYVYGATTKEDARSKWFTQHLPTARKHGVRGSTTNLQKKLGITVERIAQSADSRLANLK